MSKVKDADAVPNSSKWAGLTGWSLFEKFMTELDSEMVIGYNEDINTLLTFAGLFSAVLTAFLIESYTWLQQDNTDITNKTLGQILMQMSNSSASPTSAATADFQPLTSSVWINSLWFLSLILSLAAALFGMLAKQWLREYLKWTTMSGPPENQVCLRQARYEAFLGWRMPAIIASVPALLEVALILFFVGCDIFLWTLNGVVFGVCTFAIALFVILAFITTILPVFCPRCPYKSPAGWACLLAWQAIAHLYQQTILAIQVRCTKNVSARLSRMTHRINDPGRDWREREFSGQCWDSVVCGTMAPPIYHRDGYHLDDPHTRDITSQAQTLTRALTWIAETSQDMRLLHAVEKCKTVRIPDDWSPFSRLVLNLQVICPNLNIDLNSLVPPKEACATGGGVSTPVIAYTWFWSTSISFKVFRGTGGRAQWEEQEISKIDSTPPSIRIQAVHAIACDLLAVLCGGASAERVMAMYGVQAKYYFQSASFLGMVLIWSAVYSERRASDQLTVALDRFASIFDYAPDDDFPPCFYSLLLTLYEDVRGCERYLNRIVILPSKGATRFTRLALRILRRDSSYWSRDQCGLFVRISEDALEEWKQHDNAVTGMRETLLPRLLDRMKSCAEWCLHLQEWTVCTDRWLGQLIGLFTCCNIPPNLLPYDLVDTVLRCRDGARAAGFFVPKYDIDWTLRRSQSLEQAYTSRLEPSCSSASVSRHLSSPPSSHDTTISEVVTSPPCQSVQIDQFQSI